MSDTMEDKAREVHSKLFLNDKGVIRDQVVPLEVAEIAKALTAAHQAGVEQERERCAGIALGHIRLDDEEYAREHGDDIAYGRIGACKAIEEAIRHPQGQPIKTQEGK